MIDLNIMNNNFQFEFNKYINQKRLLKKIFDETLIAVNEIAISEYFTKGMTIRQVFTN